MKEIIIFCVLLVSFQTVFANEKTYNEAYDRLNKMLNGEEQVSFKDAVFSVENAYFNNTVDRNSFDRKIDGIAYLVNTKQKFIALDYNMGDRENVKKYASLFSVMKDTTTIIINSDTTYFLPFTYDFEDIFGDTDWSNMFVSKLLATGKGNCHSLPYLYKIIADEIGAETYLALAPNHTYIKHLCQKVGWYNTELTSGFFPQDAWLKASGYIPLVALQNGIYLRALSEKENIALCMIDLAMGYDKKYPNNDGTFILKCCDTVLKHFPKFIKALLLKADTYTQFWKAETDKDSKQSKQYWAAMEALYRTIHELGYRQMPKQMYVNWLQSVEDAEFQKEGVPRAKD